MAVNSSRLSMVCGQDEPDAAETALATTLNVPLLAASETPASPFCLAFVAQRLTLYRAGEKPATGLSVDFASTAMQRRSRESLMKQGLGKAVGLKAGQRPDILDATAGLGTDAWLLASSGCAVSAFERDPLVAALLQDGLRRAGQDLPCGEVPRQLQLYSQDARQADLAADSHDVVYLDPMFPPSRKSARVKKPMAMLQEWLAPAPVSEGLLVWARGVARRRVVVKRARQSAWLDDEKPDLSFSGRSNRYDVYFLHGGQA